MIWEYTGRNTGDEFNIVMVGRIKDVVVDEEIVVEEHQLTNTNTSHFPPKTS
jgi:hypothetical protein